jgi:transcriptional regulator GlxA family with amidase domain
VQVGIVVFDGFQTLDAFGPLEVFAGAGVETALLATNCELVESSVGVALRPDRSLGRVDEIDTLLVAGGPGTMDPRTRRELAAQVSRLAPAARRVGSVCSGAFVLAEAGLLDGRRCTTHWAYAADFASEYPRASVEADSIFVRDRDVWTSAGVTAGIDLALAMVEADMGPAVARRVAQHLVVYLQRPGGQSQFSRAMRLPATGQADLTGLLAWIQDHLDADCSVPVLASRVGVSPRTLTRRFRSELGVSPGEYVDACRVEAARQLLEGSDLTVGAIAQAIGAGRPETFHRLFLRSMRVTPARYRDSFQGRTEHTPA